MCSCNEKASAALGIIKKGREEQAACALRRQPWAGRVKGVMEWLGSFPWEDASLARRNADWELSLHGLEKAGEPALLGSRHSKKVET